MTAQWAFGRELVRRREQAGLSRRELAGRSKISEGRIRQLEAGVQKLDGREVPARPTARTVERLAEVLCWDSDLALALAGLAETERTPRAGRPSAGDADEMRTDRMLSYWHRIPVQQRDAVLQLLETMVDKPDSVSLERIIRGEK